MSLFVLRFAPSCLLVCFLCCSVLLASSDSKDKGKADDDEMVYEMGKGVVSPKLIHVVEPKFDPSSEQAFLSGVVKLQIIVTKTGSVSDPTVKSGLTDRQNEAAVEAVKQWTFEPGTHDGKPVKVRAAVEVSFRLM